NLAIHGKPAVGDPQHQLRSHHALDVDVVHNLADVRQHLAGELQLAEPERPAAPFAAAPAEVEADHLPHRVETKAAGHHRVVLEVATEEPEIRLDVEF